MNYFENEKPIRARCGWCNNITDEMPRRNVTKSKDFFDAHIEYMGLHDKARVCSTECAALWREWAKEKLKALNSAFPVVSR